MGEATSQGKVSAIVVAAGSSQRMGGIDKIFAPLAGRPLIAWSVEAFQHSPQVHQVVVVTQEAAIGRVRGLVEEHGWNKVTDVCAGGRRRQESVANGLACLRDCAWVAIHDGARPCVTQDIIERGLLEARETGAAIAAMPVADTIKVAGDDGCIRRTPRRARLWGAQTPQIFRYDIIMAAHSRRLRGLATDDAYLVERLGHRVKLYPGAPSNIKVTTPVDLAIAEALLREEGRA
ncbi:MAG: 2-C-methyl-D-erythritol 4-phosphate cytidylyltransferase [Chloroflexi bacterium]|nr:2-C-methyl-D-erythritol 4-phosphate cytidylyltransferase [Chloroflexota bacterium]